MIDILGDCRLGEGQERKRKQSAERGQHNIPFCLFFVLVRLRSLDSSRIPNGCLAAEGMTWLVILMVWRINMASSASIGETESLKFVALCVL